jgi:hypothetical protein
MVPRPSIDQRKLKVIDIGNFGHTSEEFRSIGGIMSEKSDGQNIDQQTFPRYTIGLTGLQ